MHFVIDQPALKHILSAMTPLTSRKTNLAITENVRITADAKHNEIRIEATDLETSRWMVSPAQVMSAGSACMPGKKLADIVSAMAGQIEIREAENRWHEIKCGDTTLHIVGMNPDEFQAAPTADAGEWKTIASKHLAAAINVVSPVQGMPEDRRPHITGYFFSKEKLISTDGSRLHIAEVPGADFDGILLPKRSGAVLSSMCASGDIRMAIADGRHLVCQAGGNDENGVSIRLLEGDFPDVSKFGGDGPALVFRTDALDGAMSRIAPLVTEANKGVMFVFDASPEKIRIVVTNPDFGEGEAFAGFSGNGLPETTEIPYNLKYWRQALALANDEVEIRIKNGKLPAHISDPANDAWQAFVMPMAP